MVRQKAGTGGESPEPLGPASWGFAASEKQKEGPCHRSIEGENGPLGAAL